MILFELDHWGWEGFGWRRSSLPGEGLVEAMIVFRPHPNLKELRLERWRVWFGTAKSVFSNKFEYLIFQNIWLHINFSVSLIEWVWHHPPWSLVHTSCWDLGMDPSGWWVGSDKGLCLRPRNLWEILSEDFSVRLAWFSNPSPAKSLSKLFYLANPQLPHE